MKYAITTLALAASLLVAQSAQAGWNATDTDPAMVASYFNDREVTVGIVTGTGYGGLAAVIDGKIWLTRLAYRDVRHGDGSAVWILLHEVAHTLGVVDEHAASVWGYQHLVGVLQTFYGQTSEKARGGLREAVLASRSMAPVYQP